MGKKHDGPGNHGIDSYPTMQKGFGSIFLEDEDLLQISEDRKREIRGNEISMVFQEPMTSLNPVFTIGEQIGETLRGIKTSAIRKQR